MVNVSSLKSGFPAIAAMRGVRMKLTNAVTTAVNAAPMTTATARSMTLPRMTKSLKPLSIGPPTRDALTVISRPTAASLGRHDHRCELMRRAVTRNTHRGESVDGDHEFRVGGCGRR